MGRFLLRFFVFTFLWTMLIIYESNYIAISLLFMAISVALYFLLSVKKASLFLFLALSSLMMVHSFFVDYYFYTFTLLIYLTIFSLYRLKTSQLYRYIGLHFLYIGLLNIGQGTFVPEALLIYGFIGYLTILAHSYYMKRQSSLEEYERLEGDLRRLKRRNMTMEEAARMEERTKIMRELHDSVGHKLTALIMKAEMLAIQTGEESYRELKRMAEEGLEKTREAVSVLKSEDSEGIATVVQLIRKLESESHMIVQFTLKEGVLATSLSNEKNIHLYRMIQEALTNAMRHADTREVQVSLGKTAIGHISFEVRNRIHRQEPFKFGFGLRNMKERVKEIGGELSVYQTEEEFIVRGSFPIEEV